MRRKKISLSDMIGKRGIALIDTLVGAMGYLWHPTGLEAGIDGYIEIRDRLTGEVSNAILQVQSKATDGPFDRETDERFTYTCTDRDLHYWLNGNAPVILVRSRPRTGEAYWIDLKAYFADPSRRSERTVIFHKQHDRFVADDTCIRALANVAMPRGAGLYLAAMPKEEMLYTNLLPVIEFPRVLSVAATTFRDEGELRFALHRLDPTAGSIWMLKGGNLYAFYDLSDYPWNTICDPGSLERDSGSAWARRTDPDQKRDFVHLLNLLLRVRFAHYGIDFHGKHEFYYFRDTDDLSNLQIEYRSIQRKANRMVFEAYKPQAERGPAHYRHSACALRFVSFGNAWYVEMNPTYYFTADGRHGYRFAHNSLSGIKRQEGNAAVLGQIVMWAALLHQAFTPPDLTSYEDDARLQFGEIERVTLDRGIADKAWLKTEETPEASVIQANIDSLGLFGL